MKKSELRKLIKESIVEILKEDKTSKEGYLELIEFPDGDVRLKINDFKGSGFNKIKKVVEILPAISKDKLTKEYIKNAVDRNFTEFPESEIDSLLN
jgi:hypothetical protein